MFEIGALFFNWIREELKQFYPWNDWTWKTSMCSHITKNLKSTERYWSTLKVLKFQQYLISFNAIRWLSALFVVSPRGTKYRETYKRDNECAFRNQERSLNWHKKRASFSLIVADLVPNRNELSKSKHKSMDKCYSNPLFFHFICNVPLS